MAKRNSETSAKPLNKFPLTLHRSGQYCKKIRGKFYYFGTDKHQALERYYEKASDLHLGKKSEPSRDTDDMSLKYLCNSYLEYQSTRVKTGEIKLRQLHDQTILLRNFAKYMGPSRGISEIATSDLQAYRSELVNGGKAPSTVNNRLAVVKAMYNWACENEYLSTIPNLKAVKKVPDPKKSREVFTQEQIKKLLEYANPKMKAMILLGLNCGFGCTDCSELQWKHIDLENGRISFPRPKTGVERNLLLWNKTISALKALPKTNEDERVFSTVRGNAYVRVDTKVNDDGSLSTTEYNMISKEFTKLVRKAEIETKGSLGFYALRRTAATIAAKSGDPYAVQVILGHTNVQMASRYIQNLNEQADRIVSNNEKFIFEDDS